MVLDLDGTIFDPQARPTIQPRVEEVVAEVQAHGVPVTLATGRTLDFAGPVAVRLGLRLPVVTAQGAVVGWPGTGEVLHEALLDQETTADVLRWAGRARRSVAAYVHRPGEPLRVVQNHESADPAYYDRLFGTPREVVPRPVDAVDLAHERVLKFICVNPPDEPDHAPALRRRFGGRVQIVRTHADLVEGTAPGVDKAAGVRRLLEHLGLDPSRVLAVGDNENDVPLFRLVGTSVAMATAPAWVQEHADWVAPPLEENGAAVALERFVLRRTGS